MFGRRRGGTGRGRRRRAVGVDRGRLFGGHRHRWVRREEIAAVTVVRREVVVSTFPGVAGRARQVALRTPPGRRPAAVADELRQALGLARLDRGFPVVVPGAEAELAESS